MGFILKGRTCELSRHLDEIQKLFTRVNTYARLLPGSGDAAETVEQLRATLLFNQHIELAEV